MKKTAKWTGGIVALLALTGLGVGEAWEYMQAARGEVAQRIRDSVPLEIEVRRMEQLIAKLDLQMLRQKRLVAERAASLEDAERDLACQQDQSGARMATMKVLRRLLDGQIRTVQVGCHRYSRGEIEQALSSQIAGYKSHCDAVRERGAAVDAQRMSYQKFVAQLSQWGNERDILSHRLESLKSRVAAQAAAPTATSVFDKPALERASGLADRLEKRLRVIEKQQALGADPLGPLTADAAAPDAASAFDALLASEASSPESVEVSAEVSDEKSGEKSGEKSVEVSVEEAEAK